VSSRQVAYHLPYWEQPLLPAGWAPFLSERMSGVECAVRVCSESVFVALGVQLGPSPPWAENRPFGLIEVFLFLFLFYSTYG
jgi:hypothetical protein